MTELDEPIYLDHAATTPLRREVLQAMFPYFQQVYGNPSSVHSAGVAAAAGLEAARSTIAGVLNCMPAEIVFTSGGTESDNLAIIGAAEAARGRGRHVVVSTIEHEAVLRAAGALQRRGFHVTHVPVNPAGLIATENVIEHLRPGTILASIMYANNEVGTVQPIAEIAAAIRARSPDTVIHTDAVQAAGHLPLDVQTLDVHLLSLSAHKIYGPRGVGCLYVRRGTALTPIIHGGGQENNLRSGTENVAGCVGLAEALALAESERAAESVRVAGLRDRLIAGALAAMPDTHLTGHPRLRLPGHASFYSETRSGESLLVDLDARGVCCSTGSACHTGMTGPSHVLLALGLPPHLARNGLRMTLGRGTTEQDVSRVCEILNELGGTSPSAISMYEELPVSAARTGGAGGNEG